MHRDDWIECDAMKLPVPLRASMGSAGRLSGERGGAALIGAPSVDVAAPDLATECSPATAADDACPLRLRLSARSAAACAAPVEKSIDDEPTPDDADDAPAYSDPDPLWLA